MRTARDLGHGEASPALYKGTCDDKTVFRGRPRVVEVSTLAIDPDVAGMPQTPWGDNVSPWLFVPQAPTPLGNPRRRVLARLCTMVVPWFGVARILGLRQIAEIAQLGNLGDAGKVVYRHFVEGPVFRFTDGANISWHLTVHHGTQVQNVKNLKLAPGVIRSNLSPELYQQGSAILFAPPNQNGFAAPYLPLNAAQPVGDPVASLGTFTDFRFPWLSQGTSDDIDFSVEGPAVIYFWATVWQTDPDARPGYGDLTDAQIAQLPSDDQFVVRFPRSTFRHVGGAIIAEARTKYGA